MRHRAKSHSFGRRQGPRIALLRGLVYSLVEHGRIKTTLARAKEVRRHVERAVTIGKQGTLHARRLLLSRFPNPPTVETLINDLGPRFKKRAGGYTRIVKVGARPGDQAEMAFLEFVDYEPAKATTEETVKGDATASKRGKKLAQARAKSHKRRRKIQSASRQASAAARA